MGTTITLMDIERLIDRLQTADPFQPQLLKMNMSTYNKLMGPLIWHWWEQYPTGAFHVRLDNDMRDGIVLIVEDSDENI